jgi:uncharacterized repeat protein (TIGR03833 family)
MNNEQAAFVQWPLQGLEYDSMSGQQRSSIKVGSRVAIVLKQDQRTGQLTEGIVQDILTNSANHPHGIKVRLESGAVGRVKEVLDES